jgi:drug/metabolite transporter (DMT)-like permease
MKNLKNIPMLIIAGFVVIGFFSLLILLIFIAIPETNKDILNLTIGALLGSFATVVQYWFGSSKGSADKTDLMRNKNEA